jgi:calmodulin
MVEPSSEELRETFDHFDVNNDGKIDLTEFTQIMAALDAIESAEELLIGFGAIDTDGSGLVEFDEFANWFGGR